MAPMLWGGLEEDLVRVAGVGAFMEGGVGVDMHEGGGTDMQGGAVASIEKKQVVEEELGVEISTHEETLMMSKPSHADVNDMNAIEMKPEAELGIDISFPNVPIPAVLDGLMESTWSLPTVVLELDTNMIEMKSQGEAKKDDMDMMGVEEELGIDILPQDEMAKPVNVPELGLSVDLAVDESYFPITSQRVLQDRIKYPLESNKMQKTDATKGSIVEMMNTEEELGIDISIQEGMLEISNEIPGGINLAVDGSYFPIPHHQNSELEPEPEPEPDNMPVTKIPTLEDVLGFPINQNHLKGLEEYLKEEVLMREEELGIDLLDQNTVEIMVDGNWVEHPGI